MLGDHKAKTESFDYNVKNNSDDISNSDFVFL